MSQPQTPSVPVTVEFLPGERPAVRSVELAQHFGLKHKNVLRDIDDLTRKLPESFCRLNFEPTEAEVVVPASGGMRKDRAYLLTRDAFTLLVMGWSSQRAMEWKLKYINAFNALERAALENARTEALAEGARAALAVTPERAAMLRKVVRYKGLGLSSVEIGKLVERSDSAVRRDIGAARRMGLVQEPPRRGAARQSERGR
ncbi:Rha family transcriptional regulator [Desulfovibrio sulfodismutans]|uniref:Rha family transcriptional regulator n=1 Tax=Desulfolutivibrio sulfodismutans TaxID=63561 RepID=A0A7K3NKN2_9BACT|nr:Rha family transcriptional regulator [Desulfolutivibrio sulfodismutans]NDY56315.1 Rha family transcriptional regulator [Desulfolutivibrio sulfodismutans]QLA11500.1 hypothetical protein GD606_04025 [Desulfolutivibrio sulfodismutans DSM 3696]QLA14200.1 hypothetical protein GD606_18970 [Desulfolutivibrio sulfodismutans DSM 3696]